MMLAFAGSFLTPHPADTLMCSKFGELVCYLGGWGWQRGAGLFLCVPWGTCSWLLNFLHLFGHSRNFLDTCLVCEHTDLCAYVLFRHCVDCFHTWDFVDFEFWPWLQQINAAQNLIIITTCSLELRSSD